MVSLLLGSGFSLEGDGGDDSFPLWFSSVLSLVLLFIPSTWFPLGFASGQGIYVLPSLFLGLFSEVCSWTSVIYLNLQVSSHRFGSCGLYSDPYLLRFSSGCGFSRFMARSLLVPTIKFCTETALSLGFLCRCGNGWFFSIPFGNMLEYLFVLFSCQSLKSYPLSFVFRSLSMCLWCCLNLFFQFIYLGSDYFPVFSP